MQTVTIPQALEFGVQHHQAGRLAEAEVIYRQILAVQADNPDALHLLGVIAHQVGKEEIAAEFIGKALAISPNHAVYHSNLGETYRARGQREQAIACYQRAIALMSD